MATGRVVAVVGANEGDDLERTSGGLPGRSMLLDMASWAERARDVPFLYSGKRAQEEARTKKKQERIDF